MYQTYEDSADPGLGSAHVKMLRSELKRQKLDGFIVPRADKHQGEYVPPSAQRLAWISGFTGSAGTAIIFHDHAALFVDGRYGLQAKKQADLKTFKIYDSTRHAPEIWLKSVLKPKLRLGYDPWLHTPAQIMRLERHCKDMLATLVAVKANPIDRVWRDRPAPPLGRVVLQPVRLAGVSARDKLSSLAGALKTEGQNAAILTLTDSIAWALNIRGHDIEHIPIVLCFAILKAHGKMELFIDRQKLDARVRDYLKPLVQLYPPDALKQRLEHLGSAKQTVRLDQNQTALWIENILKKAGARIVHQADPCVLPKARKNTAEIRGMRQAHLRDGVAVCRFLAWLDREAPKARLDEISAAQHLEQCRADTGHLKDISFDTISAAGPNGAIVHYRVSETSNRALKKGELYLVDSGAQYQDGTTDITRTITIGKPTAQMRRHFTLVLKGHIALSTARFAKGTSGAHLDALARAPLWQAGLDFDHGTGHGIGSYLSVHEGPQAISRRSFAIPLEPGMILSNEPGYYKPGAYGIRIENLVLVKDVKPPRGGERTMLGFETLTLAPLDRRLIAVELLDKQELDWLNDYHKTVFSKIGSELSGADKTWLKQVTQPL